MTTPNNNDYDFSKDITVDVDVDVNLAFDLDVKVDKSTDICVYVNSDADIKGNVAELFLDLEAFGDDSYVQADIAILTTDSLSMITLYAVSAVG
jgi:hypothetical protein